MRSLLCLRSRLTVFWSTPTTFAIARWLASMVAARLVTTKKGRPELNAQICAFTQPATATLLKVSRRSVQAAQALLGTKEKDQLDWQRYVGR